MPGIVALVTAISNDVVAKLQAANYPPLVDNQIKLGRSFVEENSAPPRIIFIPKSSKFGPKNVSAASRQNDPTRPERRAEISQRAIKSEIVRFEVRCWSINFVNGVPTSDPSLDFDFTQVLYQQVIQSVHLLCPGCYEISDGEWVTSKATSSQIDIYGQEFVFGLSINTPVLDAAEPLQPLGSGIRGASGVYIQDPSGQNPNELAAQV